MRSTQRLRAGLELLGYAALMAGLPLVLLRFGGIPSASELRVALALHWVSAHLALQIAEGATQGGNPLVAGELLRPDCETWLASAKIDERLREFLRKATAAASGVYDESTSGMLAPSGAFGMLNGVLSYAQPGTCGGTLTLDHRCVIVDRALRFACCRSSRQQRRAHQKFIDGVGGLAAFADRPGHARSGWPQRLRSFAALLPANLRYRLAASN